MIVYVLPGDWKKGIAPIGLVTRADMVLGIKDGVILKDRRGKSGRKFDAIGLRAVLRILSNGEEIPLPEDVRAKEMLEGNDGR